MFSCYNSFLTVLSMQADSKKTSSDNNHVNNEIRISKSRILENIKRLESIDPSISIAPVLKSDAYGHGISLVGPLLNDKKFPFFCVYSLEEAEALKTSGVNDEILIMGGVNSEAIKSRKLDFTFAAFDKEYIKLLLKYQPGARIHLYVDTGLHREGINFQEFAEVVELVKNEDDITVTGLMSHFACSNDPYCDLTKKQLADFKKAKEMVLEAGLAPQWFHFGGALALINSMTDSCNVIRCGKAIFGIGLKNLPSAQEKESIETKRLLGSFLPTLELRTKIIQIKSVQKGEYVGYVETFQAPKDMTLGILPIGYYDGVDRRLSNNGCVKIGDVFCPIVGMVSMNATIVDISDIEKPYLGQEVSVYSDVPNDLNSLDNSASKISTIPQDLLVHLQSSCKRTVLD